MTLLRRLIVAVSAVLTGTALALVSPAPTLAAPSDADLALRWTPVHYQDTDSSDYDADYLSKIDYDGEWDTLNNWEHQDDDLARRTGSMYYSVWAATSFPDRGSTSLGLSWDFGLILV